jgi:membrane protease YdiL (CAAX protease family)
MKAQTTYHPVRFFTITFLITWVTWFIAAYFSYQEGQEGLQLLFMVPGLFAPFITVVIMMFGKQNKALRQDFWRRLDIRKIKPVYWLPILLIMPAVLFAATGLSLLFGQSAQQFALSSEFMIMGGQAVVSLIILFLAPTLEELGWRGYGVDSIRSKLDVFKTTLLFAGLWALWHLPLFFINGYYQNELWHMNIAYVINFFVSILPATILMNWVYFKNGRNITASILFHFMFNLFSVLFQTEQFTKCILTGLLLVVAAVVMWKNREFFFGTGYEPQPVALHMAQETSR